MSVAAVISDIDLVGEQIFDHTPLIRKEIEKFLNNFERNERHKEFDGIIRASHSVCFRSFFLNWNSNVDVLKFMKISIDVFSVNLEVCSVSINWILRRLVYKRNKELL